MIYHVLNGDSLAYSFSDAKIEGEIIVVREGLIDGDLSGDNLHDFWQSRTRYMGLTEVEYYNKVVKEFENNSGHSFTVNYIPEVALEQQMK